MVSYDKQTVNSENFFARYAHRNRLKLCLKILSKVCDHSSTIFDYGCGDGTLLNELSQKKIGGNLIGLDTENIKPGNYLFFKNHNDVKDRSIDVLTCFETLEHLNKNEKDEFFIFVNRVVKQKGKLVVSFPIIGGPFLILKELRRRKIFKKSEYNLTELIKASFFGKFPERSNDLKGSHKGFNFKDLIKEIENNYNISQRIYSPFNYLPWFLNSQIFLVISL